MHQNHISGQKQLFDINYVLGCERPLSRLVAPELILFNHSLKLKEKSL